MALSRDMIFSMEDILDVTLRKSSETSKSNDEVFTDLVLNEQRQCTSQPPGFPTAMSSSNSFDLLSSSNSPLQAQSPQPLFDSLLNPYPNPSQELNHQPP